MKTGLKITFIVLFFSLVIVSCAAYYLLFTTSGLTFTASYLCSRLPPGTVTVSRAQGSLARGAILHNVVVADIPAVPGGVARMQEVRVSYRGRLIVTVKNGRLEMPTGEILSFTGTLDGDKLDFNAYSSLLYPGTVLKLCGASGDFRGRLTQADLYVRGTLKRVVIKGNVRLEEYYFRYFTAKDFPLRLDLVFQPRNPIEQKLSGRVSAAYGMLTTRYMHMEMRDAFCVFRGDPRRPDFKARGVTTVAGTRIRAAFSGTFDNPQLRLTSQPPMPQDRLLVILVTGKSWEGTAGALTSGRITPGMIQDFADFFLFGGSVQGLEKKLGITDLAVTYQRGQKGIEIHKSLTQSTGVIYGITRSDGTLSQTDKEQTSTVGIEYRINDAVSLEGRRQMTEKLNGLKNPPETENVIRLKFKKTF